MEINNIKMNILIIKQEIKQIEYLINKKKNRIEINKEDRRRICKNKIM